MRLPVLLAVDDDRDALEAVATQLSRRYGRDYRIECRGDPDDALQTLQGLADEGEDLALVLAASSLPSTSGRHLLEHVRQLHPHAGRALLVPETVWSDQPTADAIRDSMALGRIDYYVPRPAGPHDEVFHEAVSSFLLESARDRRVVPQTVHIVGETWSGRAYELREVFEQCALPHAFCLAASEQGRELLARAGLRREAPVDGASRRPVSERSVQRRDRRGRRRPSRARGARLRRGHRRLRAGGPLGGRLRRLGGVAHPRGGRRRHRRTGQVELADPQLPRLPDGCQRQPARRAGLPAGGRVRRRLPAHASSDRARSLRRRASPCRSRTDGASARER